MRAAPIRRLGSWLVGVLASTCLEVFSGEAQAADAPASQAVKQDAQEQTVTIEGRRAQTTRTIDSTVHNVKDGAAGQAGTVADVLNTVPSVNISPEGGVTVRGNSNVQIYINGRPTGATEGATTLQAMSGSSVASVEVITNPSARYDANGGAIVNIVLKEDAQAGVHASATGNLGDHRRANISATGSYGGKRLSVTATASARDDVRFTRVLNDREVKASDGAVIGRSGRRAVYTPTHAKSANVNGSVVYKLTPSSDLGAEFDVSHSAPKNRVFERRVDYDAIGDVTATYDRIRGGTYFGHSGNASIYYQQRGAAGHGSLRIVAQAERDWVRSDRPFVTVPAIPAGPDTAERIYIGTFNQFRRLSIDYDRPLAKGLRVSVGSELKRATLRLDNGHVAIDPVDTDDLGAPPVSGAYRAAQTSAAAYATVEARFGLWTAQAGERGQAVRFEMNGTPSVAARSRSITGLNHSLSIARDVASAQLTLKVTRTQQLFDLRDLDPLITYVDPDTRTIGNPDLSPQQVTSLEAGYNFTTRGRNGDVSLYYREARHTLADYYVFLDDNVQLSSKRNYGNARSYGIEANISEQITRTLKLSVTGNLFHTRFPQLNYDGSGEARSLYSYTAQVTADWKPDKADEFHLDANAQGPTLVPQGVKSGTYAVNTVWRHTVSARLTFSLTGQSVLRRAYVRTILDATTGYDVGKRLNGGRAVLAGFKYKIN